LKPVQNPGHYRIKTVAAAAGISTNLLRAWERRYGFFEPQRQVSQQRFYTDEDMLVVRRIRQLLDSGLTIGEVASLGRETLLAAVVPRQEAPATPFHPSPLPSELEALLAQLAPLELKPHRAVRFGGEELSVSLATLHAQDLATVVRLYNLVKGIYELWTYMEFQLSRELIVRRFQGFLDAELRGRLQRLGAATESSDALVRGALEDSRLGALSLLLGLLGQPSSDSWTGPQLRLLVTLARDHAKMMRNAFFDLDPGVREADEHGKAHGMLSVLQKVEQLSQAGEIFQVGTDYQGYISCRCLETSAMDRVLYYFLRHASAGSQASTGLWVSQINPWLCRWTFQCSSERFRLPEPDEVATRAVALAMGVTPDEAHSYAYLGCSRRSGGLWAWFHWPIFEPPVDFPRCRCEPLSS